VVLLVGLLMSEIIEKIARLLFHMYLLDHDPGVQLFFISIFIFLILVCLYFLYYLNPGLQYAEPIQYIQREFNIFRKKVKITWPEDWEASSTKTILFTFNKPTPQEEVITKVYRDSELLPTTDIWDDDNQTLEVIFNSQIAGTYKFYLSNSSRPVRGSPWEKKVTPAEPDYKTSRLVNLSSSTTVLKSGGSFSVRAELRDMFNNHIDCKRCYCDVITVTVDNEAFYEIGPCQISKNIEIKFTFSTLTVGAFPAYIYYRDYLIGKLQLLVLPPAKLTSINNYLARMGWNSYYEVSLTCLHGSVQKPKTVYVYLTDKQMIIREFYLKLIPHRLTSYRVNPQVRLAIQDKVLTIQQHEEEDTVTQLRGENILLLAATYYTILLRRVGGSETFYEKRQFFFDELTKYHEDLKHRHVRLPIRIDRSNIFESTWKVTRHFLESDWARLWEIYFDGEIGVDQGGLRREWFELVTKFIFDPQNEIFVPLEEGSSSVGPNPFPPSHIKLKHYRLAGKLVGKALYESAMGDTYRLNMNAQLAKSLLAQIIGVGTHFTMMEVDAPDLWRSKIKYILENDVEFLDLSFTQEEVKDGQVMSVDLINNGSKTPVTESNKKAYITALSTYLLCTRVKNQVEAFLEGLHTLVPDNLLSLWDESELELLLCGVRDYSIAELKKYHTVVGTNIGRYGLVLTWFWQVLQHMGKEDLSRFVQFCTGSSLLPPGGWAGLRPHLQISWGGAEAGTLPTSHTCFNMIVLPDAENYHMLEKVMMVAVREGSEGFLMT